MPVNPIIFGSTGMVGKGVLLECLDHPDVESVLLVNRQSVGIKHKKIKEVIHNDFFDFSSLIPEFKNYNACFFCLGITSVGMKEDAYHKITYDITLKAAIAILATEKEFTFCYVSGAGTDSTEKGRSMWARVKGKTENVLLSMPFKAAYMFRPGLIHPRKGIRSKTKLYNVGIFIFTPLFYLLKPFKGLITDSIAIGKAMINVVKHGYSKKIIETRDINKLSLLSFTSRVN